MDRSQASYYKNLLLDERDAILKTIERMNENEPNASLREYYDELSSYDNHPADIGSETYEMEMNLNLKNTEHLRLDEVENALERIENGDYGKCITCGKNIPIERLDILPTAAHCMNCENESLSIHYEIDTRPVEEEVLYPPFGRTFMDNEEDYNGFDGEDAWQEVARFNKTDPHNMALDWYDNNMYDENVSGTVEEIDNISNEYYLGQLPDEDRKDIPDAQKGKKK